MPRALTTVRPSTTAAKKFAWRSFSVAPGNGVPSAFRNSVDPGNVCTVIPRILTFAPPSFNSTIP